MKKNSWLKWKQESRIYRMSLMHCLQAAHKKKSELSMIRETVCFVGKEERPYLKRRMNQRDNDIIKRKGIV